MKNMPARDDCQCKEQLLSAEKVQAEARKVWRPKVGLEVPRADPPSSNWLPVMCHSV